MAHRAKTLAGACGCIVPRVGERDLDVVVLGATGVTGRRVTEYLAARAGESGVRWAAAARNAGKLEDVLIEDGVPEAQTLFADVSDPGSLAEMTARTKVVLDLVGPYTLYGRPVIEACIDAGAHYADLTGEIPFVRSVVDELHERARQAGVKVAQVCGFEALPADLAVLLAADTARERWGEALQSVEVEVAVTTPPGVPRPSDAISGGTLQSLLAVAGGEHAELITDPAALVSDPAARPEVRRVSPITLAPRNGHSGGVVAPMAPAPFINPAVIQRTAALAAAAAERPFSPFRYREGVLIDGPAPTLPLRWGAAGALAATQVGLRALAAAPAERRRRLVAAVSHVTPGSGYGPAPERLAAWRWQLHAYARTDGAHELEVAIDADGHPGYLATARMLGELGILLAEDGATPASTGCVTPAIALGSASAERFARAGVRFSVAPD
jgi:short subunit dehydrogenase-like uncharacterized protein